MTPEVLPDGLPPLPAEVAPSPPGASRPAMLAVVVVVALTALAALGYLPRAAGVGGSALAIGTALFLGFKNGWLNRELSRRILQMGVPVILAMLSQAAVNVVDQLFIGRLPADVALPGLAALGLSLPIFWLVGGALSAIGVGTLTFTGRRHAEGRTVEAGQVLMSAASVAFVLGIGFSIIGYALLPSVLPFFNSDPSVLEQGIPFARIRYIGISSMVITAAYKAFFDGTGKTHVHMVAAIVMNVVNAVLCYGLILGNLGMPRLEVAGAAWASTLSSIVGTLVMIGWSFRPSLLKRFRLYRPASLSLSTVGAIVRLSLPSGAATIIAMGGFLLFLKAVAAVDAALPPGTPPVNASATAVIIQLVMLIFLVSYSFATATAALVSQSLGAGRPELAARYSWESAKLGSFLMLAISVALFTYPDVALGVFMKSELGEGGKALAIEVGSAPLRIIAASATMLTAAVVFLQTLYGAGNTRFVMIAEGILHVTCLVPVSWLLGVAWGGGLVGIWCAAGLYVVLLAGIMGWKFVEGGWKQIRL